MASVPAVAPHAPRRLDKQKPRRRSGVFGCAMIRWQHATMTVHAATRWRRLDVIAMQRVPKALASHVAPKLAHVFWLRSEKRRNRRDAGVDQVLLHPLADAGNVPESQPQQRARHIVRVPDQVAVRLARLARYLG